MIKKEIKNSDRIKIMWKFAKPYKNTIIAGQICTIAKSICTVLMPIILANIINEVYYHRNSQFLMKSMLIYGILLIGFLLIWLVSSYNWFFLLNRFVLDIRIKLFEKIIYSKSGYLSNMKSGEIQTIINTDSEEFMHSMHANIIDVFNNTLAYISSLVFIAFINKWIALYVLMLVPLSVFMNEYLGKRAFKVSKEYRGRYGEFISGLYEYIKGMREVYIFNAIYKSKKYVITNLSKLIRLDIKNRRTLFKVEKGSEFVNLIMDIGLYIISGIFIFKGELTVGYFIAIIEYSIILKLKLQWMSVTYFNWQKSKIINLLDTNNEVDESKTENLKVDRGIVTFKNVSFKYEDNNLVLRDVSFKIKEGESIALVGASGSGKTSITKLLMGFYNPTEGSIKIDDMDLKHCSFKSIRKSIGLVQQEITIFEGSIRYNLLLGNKNISDKQIWDALDRVNLLSVVESLPDGLDTIVGKNCTGLSGGEKQRLMIARIFLKNSKILIFDEATSSLDFVSEQIVRKSYNELSRGRTTIVVAHRLSTIISCDKVLVLKDGKIVAYDSHEKLLENCHYYKQLFKEQYFMGKMIERG